MQANPERTVTLRRTGRSAVLLALLALACARAPAPENPGQAAAAGSAEGFRFVDVAAEAGISRVIHAGRPAKDHLLDSAGSGAAWLDYDRDGWLDAYIVNGWKVAGSEVVEKGLVRKLFAYIFAGQVFA